MWLHTLFLDHLSWFRAYVQDGRVGVGCQSYSILVPSAPESARSLIVLLKTSQNGFYRQLLLIFYNFLHLLLTGIPDLDRNIQTKWLACELWLCHQQLWPPWQQSLHFAPMTTGSQSIQPPCCDWAVPRGILALGLCALVKHWVVTSVLMEELWRGLLTLAQRSLGWFKMPQPRSGAFRVVALTFDTCTLETEAGGCLS